MKLSTRGKYGVLAMIDMATHYSEGIVTLSSIAKRQNISGSYLEQLFAVLKKTNLIESIRGSQGGYMLAKNPQDITVGQILRALEGSLVPVDCVEEDKAVKCSRTDICITRFVWKKIKDSINHTVDSITLENLAEECSKQSRMENQLYYI